MSKISNDLMYLITDDIKNVWKRNLANLLHLHAPKHISFGHFLAWWTETVRQIESGEKPEVYLPHNINSLIEYGYKARSMSALPLNTFVAASVAQFGVQNTIKLMDEFIDEEGLGLWGIKWVQEV